MESFDYFGPGGGSRCKDAAGPVFAHSFHVFNNATDMWRLSYNHTMSLFCRPKFYLGKVEVTDQGAETQVRSLLTLFPGTILPTRAHE